MKEDLLKIINHYGVSGQLRQLNEECFELTEAILQYETINNYDKQESNFRTYGNKLMKEHITEEFADIMVMLEQFQYYYGIEDKEIEDIMQFKIQRQLERIKEDK